MNEPVCLNSYVGTEQLLSYYKWWYRRKSKTFKFQLHEPVMELIFCSELKLSPQVKNFASENITIKKNNAKRVSWKKKMKNKIHKDY